MKKATSNASTRKQLTYLALGTLTILTLPLIAMPLNNTANWGIGDFFAAALLLFGSGLAYILISAKLHTKRSRLVAGIAVLIIFMIVWTELAVGIFT